MLVWVILQPDDTRRGTRRNLKVMPKALRNFGVANVEDSKRVIRISNLPIVVFTYTSFTKASLRMSSQSRRWTTLWASVSSLESRDADVLPEADELIDSENKKGVLNSVSRNSYCDSDRRPNFINGLKTFRGECPDQPLNGQSDCYLNSYLSSHLSAIMSDGNRIVGDTEDLISRLPDDLLNNILSLLPLKTVISTSVLSRRWNTLWATVPSLDLNVSDFLPRGNDLTSQIRRKANFLAFVERYLGLNWPCNIDILHLNFFDDQVRPEISGIKLVWSKVDPQDYQNHPPFPLEVFRHSHSDLESWIVLAERLKAHTLYISSMINTLVRPNLCTFESLGSLTLVGSMALNIPETSTFPNLRTLILEDIIIKGDDSVSNLINSCCPVLEELCVSIYGDEKDLDLLVVTAKSLRRLDLEFFGDDMTTSSTVSATRIDFFALRSLSLQNVLITDNQSGEILDGLEEADLDVSSDDGNCLFWLLTMIRNVKKLILSDCTLGSLKSCTLPTFDYLTCLKIEELDNDRAIWESLIMVLKKSPMLEDFSLEGLSFDSSRVFDSTVDHNIPRCLTSCLKTVEISPVCGRKKEIEIVAYFLKHSQVLQTMIVMVEKTGFEKIEVKKEILALPKGSPQCVVIFK